MPDDSYVFACPTVPTIVGSEMRFSLTSSEIRPLLSWPLSYVSCREITPPQFRLQWGLPTYGARLDSYSGLRMRLGDESYFDFGARSTNANGPYAAVENQRVGIASLMIGGKYQLQYWNDHLFPWWPLGDGGDKGDTAGVSLSYGMGRQGFPLSNGWSFSRVRLSLRLATGIPDHSSIVTKDGTTIYTHIEFDDIDRGDIDLNTLFNNTKQQQMDIGITVNSGAVRNWTQSKQVHRNLKIPELPYTDTFGVMIYLRLRGM